MGYLRFAKEKTGKLHEKGTPFKDGEYHIAVHAWIMEDKNRVLLTQRRLNDTFPGMGTNCWIDFSRRN